MIECINNNQGFMMVVLTAVYVIATIAICLFNYKSAQATREQVAESARQFEETNRAFLTVYADFIRNGLFVLCVSNSGNKPAKDINVNIGEEYFKNIKQEFLPNVEKFVKSNFMLGIEQKFYLTLGGLLDYEKLSNESMFLELAYQDDKRKYSERIEIRLKEIAWSLNYTTPITDIQHDIKKQRENVEKLADNLEKIRRKIEDCVTSR